MSILNKEKLAESVLRAVLGSDPHNPRGYVELPKAGAQDAIEAIVDGLISNDLTSTDTATMRLLRSIQDSIDTRLDDSAFYDERDVGSDSEHD